MTTVAYDSVWVLTIENKYGSDTTVYSSHERAFHALVEYCKELWDQADDSPMPEDANELVEAYFERNEREGYELGNCSIN